MSVMSEVVPLPSFGEVFFDARGQDRVLRVTWHEGTLVLSLWRGEMCTASFRMPMDDVGRLIDTLDVGFAEAGGQYAQDAGTGPFPQPDVGEYPGTGQYARPTPIHEVPEYDPGYPGQEATPAYGQPSYGPPSAVPYQQEPAPVAAALGPNDVLVARGGPPADRLVASYPESVPRENMIVGDSLSYEPPQAAGAYDPQAAGGPYEPLQAAGPYDPQPGRSYDPQAPGPYGPQAAGPHDPQAGRSYEPQGPGPYEPQPSGPYEPQGPGPYGLQAAGPHDPQAGRSYEPQAPGPYEPQGPGSYGPQAAGPHDPQAGRSYEPRGLGPYEPQAPGPYGPQATGSYDPPGEPVYQFPSPVPGRPAYRFDPVPEPGYPPQQQPGAVDPNDPLGLGPAPQRQHDQTLTRPYVQEQMYATGERLRPEQGDDRREWGPN